MGDHYEEISQGLHEEFPPEVRGISLVKLQMQISEIRENRLREEAMEQGLEQGLEEGLKQSTLRCGAEDVLFVLEQRGLNVSDEIRTRITTCDVGSASRTDAGRPACPSPPSHLAAWPSGRLEEMQQAKDEAFAKAVEWQSPSPVNSWFLAWARDIEITRRPDLSARHARASSNLEHEDPAVVRQALRRLTMVMGEAV